VTSDEHAPLYQHVYLDHCMTPSLAQFADACHVIVAMGYTPVQTEANDRLRAWCDLNGWPPKDWQPNA